MKLILSILCILPLFISCKSTHYTPKNFTGAQIVVGSSGGVTGMMKEYMLFDNGQLFLSKGLKGEWKELEKQKRSKTKEIFSRASELGLINVKFSHPGNMTYYIILKQPPRYNEIKWGETGVTPPENIVTFYTFLNASF